jgi:phospholipid transport system substrate-binding protein
MRPLQISAILQRRAIPLLLAALFLLPAGLAKAAPVAEAERFINALGMRTLDVLSRPGADDRERVDELAGILDQAADLQLIARLVLGRHWRAANEQQRQEYMSLFQAYARDSLAQRFGAYKGGQRFVIAGTKPVGDADALVSTQIFLGRNQAPVAVDWRVRDVGGRLVIVDIVAEGISMLVTNRSEFDSIVNSRGIEGLLVQMRTWHSGTVPSRAA